MAETTHGALCNLAVEPDKKVRRRCPKHKRRETAVYRQCYDTSYLFFRCGVTVGRGDDGEPEWWEE